MDLKIQNFLGVSIIAALFLGVLTGLWYVQSFSRSVASQRSFQVQAEGKVVGIPDVAEVTFGVLTEGGKNLVELQKQNTEKVNRIIGFLKKEGVEDKDIKTQSYNISPRYQYFDCPRVVGEISESCPPPEIVGYSISQQVKVKIRVLDKAGDLIEGMVEQGANNVYGLSFTIDEPEKLEQQAREEAIAKAKEKAQAIARAGGFRLGKLLSIQEGVSAPQPIPFFGLEVAKGGELAAPQIEPGSQEVKVTVTLTYEIK